jgi:hypothetical protein
MSKEEQRREIFIQKRARALALMLLTRREDLVIEEVKDDSGLTYIVRFHSKGKEGVRALGIEVRGVLAALSKDAADRLIRPSTQQDKQCGSFQGPVCLFLFTMQDDGGWYTWTLEPAESETINPCSATKRSRTSSHSTYAH